MNFNVFFQSNKFKIVTWAVAACIVLMFVFRAGMAVGYRQAFFSYRWGENYHRNFAGPRGGFGKDFFNERTFTESHGVYGTVVRVDGSAIIVRGRDTTEKIIQVGEDTIITRFREKIKSTDLVVDDPVVVIGNPNDTGEIEAKLIRVLPVSTSTNKQIR